MFNYCKKTVQCSEQAGMRTPSLLLFPRHPPPTPNPPPLDCILPEYSLEPNIFHTYSQSGADRPRERERQAVRMRQRE